MPEPTPEYLILLQGIHSTGQQQSRAMLDLIEVFRHHAAASAQRDTEHEAAAQRRHEELRPMLAAYQREIEARADAVAKANAEAIADRTEASAQWWKIAKYAGWIALPIVLGLASHYAPDAVADAQEVTP